MFPLWGGGKDHLSPPALPTTLVSASGSVQAEAAMGESPFGQRQGCHLLLTTYLAQPVMDSECHHARGP